MENMHLNYAMKKYGTVFLTSAVSCGISLMITVAGCSSQKSAISLATLAKNPKFTDNMELVFQSGFEGTSKIIPGKGSDDDIIGKDDHFQEKSDWVGDLDNSMHNGYFNFQYTGGDTTKRGVKLIPEPGNPKNTVLEFWIKDYWLASENTEKARVQANNYSIKPGVKEIYQSVRVFVDPDVNALKDFPKKLSWLTISEFWNNEWWTKPNNLGFRISLGIGKTKAGPGDLTFILNAQDVGLKEVWNADSSLVKVPIGKWFTMDYYLKEGGAGSGRFYMTITPEGGKKQVVFDVINFTHNTTDKTPDGLTDYNPLKLYTSKEVVDFMKARQKTLRIYWDDLKLWRSKK
jgi:hypothetical protein